MKITRDGRITIPREIRAQLGFLPGVEIEWELRDGVAVLRKSRGSGRALIEHMRGRGAGSMSTENILALTRDGA